MAKPKIRKRIADRQRPRPGQRTLKQKPEQKSEQSAPALDDIITISSGDGRARLELKKEPSQPQEAKPALAEKKEPVFRLPKKPKSIIPTRAPKAAMIPKKNAITKKKIASGKKPIAEKPFSAPALNDVFMFGSDAGSVAAGAKKESRPEKKLAPPEASKQSIAEAALFLSPRPLMLDELARIMGVSSLGYVKEILESIAKSYEGRGIEVVSSPSGWEMQVRPQHLGPVAHLAPYADLSEGPKRALALILFKEPLKQSDLIKMQGNKVYDYLKTLDRMGMIMRKPHGRTKLLSLTKEFERYFGEEKARVKERLAQELAGAKFPESLPQGMSRKKLTVDEAARKFNIDVDLNAE